MIYWTPLDLEQVFDGWDRQEKRLVDINYDGLLLQVEPLEGGKAKIIRLISGNPSDYLRSDLAPGEIVSMT